MQPQFQNIPVHQDIALSSSLNYLMQEAPHAKFWYIQLASQQYPVNRLFWQNADHQYNLKQLDPNTAQELKLLPTQGGDFFYQFHFQLFGVPILVGRMIVSAAAFLMLIVLISGVITHKKIFVDFFTLRTFKGQRSWSAFFSYYYFYRINHFFLSLFAYWYSKILSKKQFRFF